MVRRALVPLLLAACCAPAAADELLVGVLRDQDGAAVAGARIEAVDGSGRVVARDSSAADGTFAVTAAERPAALEVRAAESDPARIVVPPSGPAVGIVRRRRAADLVPSAADVAALPAGSLGELGTVVPYRFGTSGLLTDRGLSRGRSVLLVEGLPFYRRNDGGDAGPLLPSHATGALDVAGPLDALRYGDRAGGGVIDARLFDRADTARAGSRDALLSAEGSARGALAESWDPDGVRRLAGARVPLALGPVAASFLALAGTSPVGRYLGAGAEARAATRVLDLRGDIAFTRDDPGTTAVGAGSTVQFTLDVAGRSPAAIGVRARYRDERGDARGFGVEHRDAALVLSAVRGTGVRVGAETAFAYGAERLPSGAMGTGLGILPSLSLDAPLDPRWSLHAGARAATLGTPGIALARSSLVEAALRYGDRSRLRAELIAYAEGYPVQQEVTRGLAASLGWELAPRLSLRAWSARSADLLQTLVTNEYGARIASTRGRSLESDLVWLTWDGYVRADLLVRAGALEGGVLVPLTARYGVRVGTWRSSAGPRVLSVALCAR